MILADHYDRSNRNVRFQNQNQFYLTINQAFNKRLSATRPRSSTRPSTVVSILPPHNGTTTLQKQIIDYEHKHFLTVINTFFLSIQAIDLVI